MFFTHRSLCKFFILVENLKDLSPTYINLTNNFSVLTHIILNLTHATCWFESESNQHVLNLKLINFFVPSTVHFSEYVTNFNFKSIIFLVL